MVHGADDASSDELARAPVGQSGRRGALQIVIAEARRIRTI